jgi:Spy/CpxP family protein refolding chaperone
MKAIIFVLLSLITLGTAQAQQPAPDFIAENLFSPEAVMQNQQAIGLTQEQKDSLKAELRRAQTQFTELQWQLQDEVEKLATLVKQQQIDEAQALAQLDKVLTAEREIKRAQIALLVRIKNRLTAEQQAKLQEMLGRSRPR